MIKTNAIAAEELDKRFASGGELYGSFADLPLAWQCGHDRRMELLDTLDIGDVREMDCLDFGMGSWGFACIYPRLHQCRFAYGMDMSAKAVEISRRKTEAERLPFGRNFRYMVSDGMELPLPDNSVDLVFTGETIEHIRFPKRFLSECHRVLRRGGQLIITTPNRDALLYRTQRDLYCVGSEHFWIMSCSELTECLAEFFTVNQRKGFNGSIYRDLDRTCVDRDAGMVWARLFEHHPDLATGLIVRCTKAERGGTNRYPIRMVSPEAIDIVGRQQTLELTPGLSGTVIDDPQSSIGFVVPPCDGLVIHFWAHSWGGIASVRFGQEGREVDLFSIDGGWMPLHLPLRNSQPVAIEIRPTGAKDHRSASTQVIFFEAFTYLAK